MTDRGQLALPGGVTLGWCSLEGRSGHEAAWALLEELWGGPLPEVRRTDRGKPYFPEERLHFSLSHLPQNAVLQQSGQRMYPLQGL